MIVINLFGQPSAGKSTVRAGLFYFMKLQGYAVEEVTEFAKDVVWDRNLDLLKAQDYVFAQQRWRIERLLNHNVEYCITDSPILLSLLYAPEHFPASFTDFVLDMYRGYRNVNIYLKRVKPYVQMGRTQNEAESDALADDVRDMLVRYDIDNYIFNGDENAPHQIMRILESTPELQPKTKFGKPLIWA